MDRSGFLKLLSKELYPLLRAEGFRGSGTTLRRITEPLVHIFNFQGSISSDECYINLGTHLSFLPSVGSKVLPAASLKEYHCVFRDRIEPPTGQAHGWAYGQTPEPFFRRYASYPESFVSLVNGTDPDEIHPSDALQYARIAVHLGLRDRARAFAEAGLASTPETATTLLANLKAFVAELDSR